MKSGGIGGIAVVNGGQITRTAGGVCRSKVPMSIAVERHIVVSKALALGLKCIITAVPLGPQEIEDQKYRIVAIRCSSTDV